MNLHRLFGTDPIGHTGVAGLYLFAFTAAFSVSLAYLGLMLFSLAFVAQGPHLRPLLAEPVVQAGLVLTTARRCRAVPRSEDEGSAPCLCDLLLLAGSAYALRLGPLLASQRMRSDRG